MTIRSDMQQNKLDYPIGCIAIVYFMVIGGLSASAQEQSARQLSALPALIGQRNNALDGLALCSGDLVEAQRLLVEVRKQFDELKKTVAPKDEPKP